MIFSSEQTSFACQHAAKETMSLAVPKYGSLAVLVFHPELHTNASFWILSDQPDGMAEDEAQADDCYCCQVQYRMPEHKLFATDKSAVPSQAMA